MVTILDEKLKKCKTMSENKSLLAWPGIEPGPLGWQATMLTTRPRNMLNLLVSSNNVICTQCIALHTIHDPCMYVIVCTMQYPQYSSPIPNFLPKPQASFPIFYAQTKVGDWVWCSNSHPQSPRLIFCTQAIVGWVGIWPQSPMLKEGRAQMDQSPIPTEYWVGIGDPHASLLSIGIRVRLYC